MEPRLYLCAEHMCTTWLHLQLGTLVPWACETWVSFRSEKYVTGEKDLLRVLSISLGSDSFSPNPIITT